MNKHLRLTALFVLLLPLAGWSQSTNGGSDPKGRDNWFPNRGNVGIGTRTPSAELEVIGSVRVSETTYTQELETTGLRATTLSVSQDASVGRNLSVSGSVGINVVNPTEKLEVGGNVKVTQAVIADELRVRSLTTDIGVVNNSLNVGENIIVNGQIGIGVTPTEKLDVAGAIKSSTDVISVNVKADHAYFTSVDAQGALTVNGTTGIGVVNPVEKLEVDGNIKATAGLMASTLSLSGDATVSGAITSSTDVISVNVRADHGYFKSMEAQDGLMINGKVGIGVNDLVEKLEVDGSIKATVGLIASTLTLSGDAAVSGNANFNGNIGIGTSAGADKLTVMGNSYFNGLLTAESLTVKSKLNLNGTLSLAGTVGIGVATPEAELHVNGDGLFAGNIRAQKIIVDEIEIAGQSGNPAGGEGTSVSLGDNLFVNGVVGIGTTKTEGYKLSVDGKIRAGDDIKVYASTEWSDFVFEKDYKLRSLDEVDAFIQKHGHLPEIPSAENVKNNGINLVEMDAKLLQKIEELTLYMIQVKQENERLRSEIEQLKSSRKK